MMTIRRSNERGAADHGWLKSQHSFSFADYYDPQQMGFGPLRVINEDYIAGGGGFGAHPHRDMEIITYVISGALEHRDSMGNHAVIVPGEVQRMTAGTGVVHSEFNEKKDETVHLLQIWIQPNRAGLKPGYEQKSFEKDLNSKPMVLVASPDARDGSVAIHQDANLYISRLPNGESINFDVKPGRKIWLQLVKGGLKVQSGGGDQEVLRAGDAIALSGVPALKFESVGASEALVFDLP